VWAHKRGVNDPQTGGVGRDYHAFSIVVPLGKYHLRAKTGRSEMFESRGSNGALMTTTETPSCFIAVHGRSFS
jgi:hypothetical protein